MGFCGNCGSKISDNEFNCPVCGKKIREKPVSRGSIRATGPVSQDSNLSRSDTMGIVLADGEVEIRSYFLTRVLLSKIQGFLHITNKRIIFNANSSDSNVFMSTPIETVGSINVFNGRALDWKQIIFGILSIFVGILNCFLGKIYGSISYSSSGGSFFYFFAVLLFGLGAFLIYLGTRRGLYLCISALNSSPGLVVGKGNTTGASFYTVEGVAGRDALQVMNEIGAVVLDLQQLGDLAIKKWKA